jgi:hypothetical protein
LRHDVLLATLPPHLLPHPTALGLEAFAVVDPAALRELLLASGGLREVPRREDVDHAAPLDRQPTAHAPEEPSLILITPEAEPVE